MPYEERARPARPSNIILEERERLSVSGVEDVLSFDENEIVMSTVKGELLVRGVGLKVGRLSVDTGEISVEGEISEIAYGEAQQQGGLWSRLFG